MSRSRRGKWLASVGFVALTVSLALAVNGRLQRQRLIADAEAAEFRFIRSSLQPRWVWRWIEGKWSRGLAPVEAVDGSVPWYFRRRQPVEPELMARLGGFRELNLEGRFLTDADVATLLESGAPDLESLCLRHNDVTDATLDHAAELSGLRELNVSACPVTRAGIDRLRSARPDLKVVADPFTRVGLGTLHRRIRIQREGRGYRLEFRPETLSSAEAARLADVPRSLWVTVEPAITREISWRTQSVEPEVFRTLGTLPNLKSLEVRVYHVASELESLRRAPALRELNVQNTDVGDESIEAIAAIRPLKRVRVSGSRVTPEGLARFRALRPDVDVGMVLFDD